MCTQNVLTLMHHMTTGAAVPSWPAYLAAQTSIRPLGRAQHHFTAGAAVPGWLRFIGALTLTLPPEMA